VGFLKKKSQGESGREASGGTKGGERKEDWKKTKKDVKDRTLTFTEGGGKSVAHIYHIVQGGVKGERGSSGEKGGKTLSKKNG